MANPVLTFVIVGHKDHPIFDVDLVNKSPEAAVCLAAFQVVGDLTLHRIITISQDRAQYLHQFVLHSSLDAVDDMIWATQAMFLNVVDKFNALQVWAALCIRYTAHTPTPYRCLPL